jgi:hypothetical protein
MIRIMTHFGKEECDYIVKVIVTFVLRGLCIGGGMRLLYLKNLIFKYRCN